MIALKVKMGIVTKDVKKYVNNNPKSSEKQKG